jgi:hypothetical protein
LLNGEQVYGVIGLKMDKWSRYRQLRNIAVLRLNAYNRERSLLYSLKVRTMIRSFLFMLSTLAILCLGGCQDAAPSNPQVSSEETSQKASGDDDTDSTGVGEAAKSDEQHEQHEHGDDTENHDDHGVGMGHGPGMGRGFRGGRGAGGMGGRGMGGFQADMRTIHGMFGDRDQIRRTVKMLPDGAEALTESDDDEVVLFIQNHVPKMDGRVLGNQPLPPMTFHPVFVALIENAEKYSMDYEDTDRGVKVTYQSDDPYVVMLVQEHARLVSRFIKNGEVEIHSEYELPEFDDRVGVARTQAIKARDALFKKLSGRLMEVIQAQGPAVAIQVCSQEAPQIAQSIGQEFNVKIGRTAVKLRNPKNSAPDWVEPLLESNPTEAEFVRLEEGTVGALLPIRMQQKCMLCHGPADTLQEDIRVQLHERYPDDAATGFREGDLRGWFWIESPLR